MSRGLFLSAVALAWLRRRGGHEYLYPLGITLHQILGDCLLKYLNSRILVGAAVIAAKEVAQRQRQLTA